MSIGRRLIDLARAELNSLLERAANSDDDDGGGREADRYGSADVLSDQELEAELERRKQAREEAEAAARGERPASRQSRRPASPPPRRSDDAAIRQAYAALEIAPGSDFEAVRKAYRTLMRKYHPDLHKGHPDANKVAQGLTDAYKLLEKKLRR